MTLHLLKILLGLTINEISQLFAKWNKGKLNTYLLEITSKNLSFKDTDNTPLVEKILDVANQKGTGGWATITALETGVPFTLASEAVFARRLSTLKGERLKASRLFPDPNISPIENKIAFIENLQHALYASILISYAQGFMLINNASKEYSWAFHNNDIALLWQSGCIIRAAMLKEIQKTYKQNPELENLIVAPYFRDELSLSIPHLRETISAATRNGMPIPAVSSAIVFFDGYRSTTLPANLLQAQRDFFGSHTYERTDKPRGDFFHTNWGGEHNPSSK